jgi:hypothetical protein
VMVMNRRGSLFQSWCRDCGEQTVMVRLEEAVLVGVSLQAICRQVDARRTHLVELADGSSFICLNSLLKQLSKGERLCELTSTIAGID